MIITLAGRGGGKVESSILMWPLLKPLLNRDGQHRISLPISLIYICSDMHQLKGTWLPNSVQVILWRAFMFCVTVLKSIKHPTERCIMHYYGFQVRKKLGIFVYFRCLFIAWGSVIAWFSELIKGILHVLKSLGDTRGKDIEFNYILSAYVTISYHFSAH